MIAYLNGLVFYKDVDYLVLLVGGVGYEVMCSQNTLSAVNEGDKLSLWIHTHVREDVFQLFGFILKVERQLFLSLTSVSGIGPKMAMTILSATTVDKLTQMIEESDVKGLVRLPKIGKKTAEQIILSLKGHLVSVEAPHDQSLQNRKEIVSALMHLGFRLNEIEKVVEELPPSVDVQEGVREALAALS